MRNYLLFSLSFLILGVISTSSLYALSLEQGSVKKSIGLEKRPEDRNKTQEQFAKDRLSYFKKLETISDPKRKEVLEALSNRMVEINTKRTSSMSVTLSKLETILTKIQTQSTTSESKELITLARSTIQEAREAVAVQATNQYIITITTESNLKTDFGQVRSRLAKDLSEVEKLVHTARKAAREAVMSLSKQTES